jgi:cysteine desulfurase
MTAFPDIIYLDHNATTPVAEEVLEAMMPFFRQIYGNAASSAHPLGRRANDAVDKARQAVAAMLNCHEQEVTFTSGATEGINTALKGIFWRYATKGKHFVSLPTEHKAVLDTLQWLKKQGAEVTLLPVDHQGYPALEELRDNIRPDTIAVVMMAANNETGLLLPMNTIADVVHEKGALLVCDATQAVGKISTDVQAMGVDVLLLSAHKMYGPKGVGAMYLRRRGPRVSIEPLLHGGGHERGIRSGTLNVPGIVALGKCAELSNQWLQEYNTRIRQLRDNCWHFLQSDLGALQNGSQHQSLPNTLNFRIPGIKASRVISKLHGRVALSTGSACSSAQAEPSHVLLAMGLSKQQANESLRVSWGLQNTMQELEQLKKAFIDASL